MPTNTTSGISARTRAWLRPIAPSPITHALMSFIPVPPAPAESRRSIVIQAGPFQRCSERPESSFFGLFLPTERPIEVSRVREIHENAEPLALVDDHASERDRRRAAAPHDVADVLYGAG